MILGYGSYRSAQDECTISMEANNRRSQSGGPIDVVLHRWTIDGEVQGSTAAAIVAAFQALEAAFSVDGRDLILYFNDGTTVAHGLYSAAAINGVQITQPPHYPRGDGTELHNCRSYRIVVEAEFLPDNTLRDVLSFDEAVSVEGGGPELAVVPLLRGVPQIQIVYEQTEVIAIQEGSAVGRLRYPTRPQPLWPGLEWRRRRRVRRYSPRLRSVSPKLIWTEYRIEWSYTFISTSDLVGIPNRQF